LFELAEAAFDLEPVSVQADDLFGGERQVRAGEDG
jgi:hypothetical protein